MTRYVCADCGNTIERETPPATEVTGEEDMDVCREVVIDADGGARECGGPWVEVTQ